MIFIYYFWITMSNEEISVELKEMIHLFMEGIKLNEEYL